MFKFTIRELLLLTVIAAMAAALWVERSKRLAADARRDKTANRAAKLEAALLDTMGWRAAYEHAYRQLGRSIGGPRQGLFMGITKRPAELPPELRKDD